MTDSDYFGVSRDERDKFRKYQSRVFFSKADGAYPPDIREAHLDAHREQISILVPAVLHVPVVSIDELPRRTLHYVYRVRTPEKSYIVRINACGAFYREFQFVIERWVTEAIKTLGIPTMTVYAVDISRSRVPFDFEILDDAGTSVFDRSKDEKLDPEMLTKFGAHVANIHTLSTQGYGPFDVERIARSEARGIYDTWASYVTLNADRHLETCAMAGIMNSDMVSDASRILANTRSITVENPVLLHGDLAHHNVFTDGERITTLIDWEDCASGDPVFDLAYYATGCFGNDAWYESFMTGYQSVGKLPSDFAIRFSLYYLRIAIAKALVRERFGTAASVHLPHVENRIRFAIDQAKKQSI